MIVCLGTPAGSSVGDVFLSDGNSIAEFDFESEAGMYTWEVDAISHLWQQWFWYRLGAAGGEVSLDTLPLVSGPLTSDTNSDGNDDAVSLTYNGVGLNVEMRFVLVGGEPNSHTSTIYETITITNVGQDTLDLHFFQYADFDLWDDAEYDSVEILGDPKNTAVQWEGPYYMAETVATGASESPTHYEAGTGVDSPNSIWERLTDGSPTTLTDFAGPLEDIDAVWAFQWDKTLAPDGTLVISKAKNITPEPATLALMGGGMAMALVARQRRKR